MYCICLHSVCENINFRKDNGTELLNGPNYFRSRLLQSRNFDRNSRRFNKKTVLLLVIQMKAKCRPISQTSAVWQTENRKFEKS